MAMINGYSSALYGINKGLSELNRRASDIASPASMEGTETPPMIESIVGLRQAEVHLKAAMKVVVALDEVLGTLLDEKA